MSRRLLLGSVAERVVRGARCPVLVAPARRPAPSTPGSPDLICEPCRTRIRGEVLERKRCDERAGRL